MTGLYLFLLLLLTGLLGFWLVGERGRLIRPSTWAFLKESGIKSVFNLNAIQAYLYGRWPSKYLGVLYDTLIPRLRPRGRKWWRDRYHSKVLTPIQAQSLIALEEDIIRQDLEQIIPYPMARSLVLNGPPEVAVHDCACRINSGNNCGPTQVCMVVGQPFVDFIVEHHPESSRRLTTMEALQLLEETHARGSVHAAWFSETMMGRFYALCNCCSCCCGGIKAMREYDSPMVASSGFVSQVDTDICIACGDCAQACPFDAITVEDFSVVDWDKCMGCGVCETICASEAITLVRDELKGDPLDVRMLAHAG
jgi:ferredoxin